MTVAAANFTPVTLEIGGKCPAVLTQGSVTPDTVSLDIGKTIESGQVCVLVDYRPTPRLNIDCFIDLARENMASTAPDY